MSQDWKCALGLHKYGEPEVKEVKNKHDEVIKSIYVSRCGNCGKLKVKHVFYESDR